MLCFMNEIDWVILAVLAISTVLGVSRGVVREILAIVGWVLGLVFGDLMMALVDPRISFTGKEGAR